VTVLHDGAKPVAPANYRCSPTEPEL
jgi:hypothetical protein